MSQDQEQKVSGKAEGQRSQAASSEAYKSLILWQESKHGLREWELLFFSIPASYINFLFQVKSLKDGNKFNEKNQRNILF